MSATVNHSPGPWEAVPTVHTHRKLLFAGAPSREYFIGTIIGGSRTDLAVFRANIAVIEAAPKLLEELQHAQEIIRQLQHMLYHRGVDDNAEWPLLREKNRLSILAQVSGQSS
jgi:hypothetical protein